MRRLPRRCGRGRVAERVPVSTVALTPRQQPYRPGAAARHEAPRRPPVHRRRSRVDRHARIAGRAAIGGPLRIGLLWRAVRDAPDAVQFKLRLSAKTATSSRNQSLPLLGGRVAPSTLHAGNVVRDEQSLLIGASVPAGEPLSLDVDVLDARGTSVADSTARLGSLNMTGRAHVVDGRLAGAVEATFGRRCSWFPIGSSRPRLERATSDAETALARRGRDEAGVQGVCARARPDLAHRSWPSVTPSLRMAKRRLRAGWSANWSTTSTPSPFPRSCPPGDYPIEVGIYDPRSGDRLKLDSGENHLVLAMRLHVQ